MAMTPQEIHDYKLKWLPGNDVKVHSDLTVKAKDWCRRHLERYQWSMTQYTDVYEHTFHFEIDEDAYDFERAMKR